MIRKLIIKIDYKIKRIFKEQYIGIRLIEINFVSVNKNQLINLDQLTN